MNEILMNQLRILQKDFHFEVDGDSEKGIDEPFSEIRFCRKDENVDEEITVVFEDYIIHPFNGFDLHDKWNNGIAPHAKVMHGKITGETKGMYKFELHSETSDKIWSGWCPKKSCTIK